MRTETEHLPLAKRHELDAVVRILFEEFDGALAGKSAERRRSARILKVILYGSYARGDWVSDPVGGYFSDFDVLVVVNDDELADVVEYWSLADDRLTREHTVSGILRTPVSFIVHGIEDLNRQLRRGRPFFRSVVQDGIALYEAPDHPLAAPSRLTADEVRSEAGRNFDEWFPSAENFLKAGDYLRELGAAKEGAFQYHQATERLYHCVLLVFSLFSPKSHKLNLLRSQAEELVPAVRAAFPARTRFEQRGFELLRRAYVEARYSPHYRISPEEIEWVAERVSGLRDVVREACLERLAGWKPDHFS